MAFKTKTEISFIKKHLVTLIIILAVLNLLIIFWGSFGLELFNAANRKRLLDSREIFRKPRPLRPATILTGASKTNFEPTGGSNASLNFELISCVDDFAANAVAQVRPAVVYIKTTVADSVLRKATSQNGVYFDTGSNGSSGEKSSIGSGVIVDPKGYILTNYHVIAEAQEIIVTTFGFQEKVYSAQVVKINADSDLAVLKIDSREPFLAANLGNSSLIEVADTVLAIGNPFGLEQTVTKGIISDNKRNLEIEERKYEDMIQTDAAINRGNSGGPLINMDGDVIGINTAIYAPTGVFSGVGFAIPINKAKLLLTRVGLW